ncbi:MAG: urease accessory protein UreF [Paracoccaceae bacterium]
MGDLTLHRWLSASYPTGAFAFSHGLEAAIRSGEVADAAGLRVWLGVWLRYGSGRTDAILLRRAAGGEDAAALSELAECYAPSEGRRRETMEQGAALARAFRAEGIEAAPGAYPVVLGGAMRAAGLDPGAALPAILQAMASNLIQAALRLMPLGQSEGVRILSGLSGAISEVAEDALTADPDDLGGCGIAVDMAGMAHDALAPRIFRS